MIDLVSSEELPFLECLLYPQRGGEEGSLPGWESAL